MGSAPSRRAPDGTPPFLLDPDRHRRTYPREAEVETADPPGTGANAE